MKRTRVVFALLCMACVPCGFNPLAAKGVAIQFEAPPPTVMDTRGYPLQTKVVDKNNAAVTGQTVSYAVAPPEAAVVTADGDFRCVQSGDVTVNVTSGTLANTFTVACRPVTTIEVPPAIRVLLDEPTELKPVLKDMRGEVLTGVDYSAALEDTQFATLEKGKLTGLAVGRTKLRITAGDVVTTTNIEVGRRYFTDSLALNDGNGQTWAMPAGRYEVEIQVKSMESEGRNAGDGVSLAWLGTTCAPADEAQSIEVVCDVTSAASMTVINPPLGRGRGPMVTGFINVYLVP